jgi:hypothetical protein
MRHLGEPKRTEPEIRYNEWRGEGEGEGEGAKDELAATIRLSVKICTRGRGQTNKTT